MARSPSPEALGLPMAHVSIGDCAFATRPTLLLTVLGSCVCATFHHPGRRAGGMFHAMLPEIRAGRRGTRPCTFADAAVALMVERFQARGMDPADLVVKLFGGANTLLPSASQAVNDSLDVGRKNVDSALAALAAHGLRPVARDVLGARGRKLFFDTRSGEIWLSRLTPDQSRSLPPEERG